MRNGVGLSNSFSFGRHSRSDERKRHATLRTAERLAVAATNTRQLVPGRRKEPGTMMIKGVGGVPIGATAGRTSAGRPGFNVASTTTNGPAALSAPTALDGLLLLQEVADAPTRDRRARQHARALLDALGRLQLGLLGGEPAGQSLDDLAAMAQSCPEASDPALQDVLAAIALRAQVELARRGL